MGLIGFVPVTVGRLQLGVKSLGSASLKVCVPSSTLSLLLVIPPSTPSINTILGSGNLTITCSIYFSLQSDRDYGFMVSPSTTLVSFSVSIFVPGIKASFFILFTPSILHQIGLEK